MDKQLATTTEARATLAFATHDHGRCVQQALSQARFGGGRQLLVHGVIL